jgi:hypothetical protein
MGKIHVYTSPVDGRVVEYTPVTSKDTVKGSRIYLIYSPGKFFNPDIPECGIKYKGPSKKSSYKIVPISINLISSRCGSGKGKCIPQNPQPAEEEIIELTELAVEEESSPLSKYPAGTQHKTTFEKLEMAKRSKELVEGEIMDLTQERMTPEKVANGRSKERLAIINYLTGKPVVERNPGQEGIPHQTTFEKLVTTKKPPYKPEESTSIVKTGKTETLANLRGTKLFDVLMTQVLQESKDEVAHRLSKISKQVSMRDRRQAVDLSDYRNYKSGKL